MGETELYCRENIEQFFKWKAEALEHFTEELDCEDKAAEYAAANPRASGFITVKSNYRGKRFFWIERGKAEELDAMVCFLRVKDRRTERAKKLIYQKIFRGGLKQERSP